MRNILKLKENVFLMTRAFYKGTIDIQCLKCERHDSPESIGSMYRRNPVACQGSKIQNQECLVHCFTTEIQCFPPEEVRLSRQREQIQTNDLSDKSFGAMFLRIEEVVVSLQLLQFGVFRLKCLSIVK